jgi:hypothetical protein
MKRWTLGLTAAIACVSLYVFAAYKPKLSALQKKIIAEMTAAANLLSEGTKLVLTGEPAQKSITAKREEYERAAKKALERQKSLSGRGKTGGYSGYPSSYGKNRYGGGGGSYNPYGGGGGSYGGSYGRSYGGGGGYNPYHGGGYDPYDHAGLGYDDHEPDHQSATSKASTTPGSSSSDSSSGGSGGADLQAKQAAEKAAQERAEADQELIDAAEKIATAMGGSSPSSPGYEDKIKALKDDGTFGELASGARTHHKNTKKTKAPAPAPAPATRKPGMPTPRKPAAAKPVAPKASPLDGKIAGLYNRILPHVIFAATCSGDTSATDALRSDIKHVVGQTALDSAAQGAIKIQLDEWKAGIGKDFAAETAVFKHYKPFITQPPTRPVPWAALPAGGPAASPTYTALVPAAPAAAVAPAAPAPTFEQMRAAFKKYFTDCKNELDARAKKFQHIGVSESALGALDTQKKNCKQMLDVIP